MKRITISSMLIAGLLLFSALQISAQTPNGKPCCPSQGAQMGAGMGQGHGPCIPGLTDDQKAKIEALKLTFMKEVLPLKNLLAEKEARLRTLSTGDKIDMLAANAVIDEIAGIQAQIQKLHLAHRMEVRKLLNDEQKLWFDMHGGQGNCGQGNGNGQGCGQGNSQGQGCGQGNPQGQGRGQQGGGKAGCGSNGASSTQSGCGQQSGNPAGCGQH